MDAVASSYEKAGWAAEDVSAEKVGWDLTFTQGDRIARVEVTGVSGDHPNVLLTANEIRAAKEVRDWSLAVVTRALSNPVITEFCATEVAKAAKPYLYKANLEP